MDDKKIRYLFRGFLLFVLSLLCCSATFIFLYKIVGENDSDRVSMYASWVLTVISNYALFLKLITSIKDGRPESDMLGTPINTPINTPNASPQHHFQDYQVNTQNLQIHPEIP